MKLAFWSTGILKVTFSFFSSAVMPRGWEIILTQESAISIALGFVASKYGNTYFPHSGKLVDVALGFIAYGAIALGFCVAGVTIALTLPNQRFVKKLATLHVEDHHGDALSSLLFVFCWTAVVHWMAVVTILAILLGFGQQDGNVLAQGTHLARFVLGSAIAICVYALSQFLITVMTLWQVGAAYAHDVQSQPETG